MNQVQYIKAHCGSSHKILVQAQLTQATILVYNGNYFWVDLHWIGLSVSSWDMLFCRGMSSKRVQMHHPSQSEHRLPILCMSKHFHSILLPFNAISAKNYQEGGFQRRRLTQNSFNLFFQSFSFSCSIYKPTVSKHLDKWITITSKQKDLTLDSCRKTVTSGGPLNKISPRRKMWSFTHLPIRRRLFEKKCIGTSAVK